MVKPKLAFVNFFKEARGRRVVEVSNITVPDDADHQEGWPRHHSDFKNGFIYQIKWPHLQVEGSFSTESEYDAKILCFGVSIEDLIHEAKATGYKIPSCDIEKFKNYGQPPVSKVKSPAAKTSSKGRKIKQQSNAPASVAPPPSHAKKKKKPLAEDKARRSRNVDFITTLDVPFSNTDDINMALTIDSASKSTGNLSRNSNSRLGSKSISSSSTSCSAASRAPASKKAVTVDHGSNLKCSSKSSGSENRPTSLLLSPNATERKTEKDKKIVKTPDNGSAPKLTARPSNSNTKSKEAGAAASPFKALKTLDNKSNLRSSPKSLTGSESRPNSLLSEPSTLKRIETASRKTSNSFSKNTSVDTGTNAVIKRKATQSFETSKPKKRRNKDLTCSSEDDENSSYVSSTEAAETRTLLYISKIQKLELQLKKLKQENLALKEKDFEGSPCSQQTRATPNKHNDVVSTPSMAKRSIFKDSSSNCDYADNTTISQMIVDAFEKKAPLRKDGTGKVHLGNGVYVTSKLFEEKLMASKVSPSIATRDLMSHMYSTKELAERSLEGGTPVKGGPDRKKMKKNRLTPSKRECLFGLFRAKTQINTGSTDKNFLDLSVEKKGKCTIRSKLKEAAKKIREEAAANASRTAEEVNSSQGMAELMEDAVAEMGSTRDQLQLTDEDDGFPGYRDDDDAQLDDAEGNQDEANAEVGSQLDDTDEHSQSSPERDVDEISLLDNTEKFSQTDDTESGGDNDDRASNVDNTEEGSEGSDDANADMQ